MILYILDINNLKRQKSIYTIVTIFCIIFAIIYESFSHGVISYFMILSFLIPLTFGVIVNFVFISSIKKMPTIMENNLYNAGIATLTIGSIVEGVLQIYGTTNMKIYVYLIIGIMLIIFPIIRYLSRYAEYFDVANK